MITKNKPRIDKINYYLDIAETVLERCTCLRRKFGAVIVKNDEIISTGYAGAPRGRKNCNELGYCAREKMQIPRGERYEMCRSVHAEQNAMLSVARRDMIDATMYLVGKRVDTKEYEKGLQLYSNGVLIMDKCAELLPDYFSFVKGLVDSSDLSLNISREILQQDRQLRTIEKSIEKKIKNELESMLKNDREKYEKFFKNFGTQLKFGCYNDFGVNKDKLKDLIMFYSSETKKLTTLKEYIERAKQEQESIYYASGETIDKIDMLPQVQAVKEKGYEILYLTENIDEFVLKVLTEYDKKKFVNVSSNSVDLETEEEKEELKKVNEENKEMFELMKEAIKDVQEVKFTHKLKNHPICLSSQGEISAEMEKVLNSMPMNNQNVKARMVLEINENHEIAEKIKSLYLNDKEELKKYSKVLYNTARLIEGLSIENPTDFSNLVCDLISK